MRALGGVWGGSGGGALGAGGGWSRHCVGVLDGDGWVGFHGMQ